MSDEKVRLALRVHDEVSTVESFPHSEDRHPSDLVKV